jgi:hypothetical protein
MITNLNLKNPITDSIKFITTGEYCQEIVNIAQKIQN